MWSVGLPVCNDHEPCKNGWTFPDAVRDLHLGGPKEFDAFSDSFELRRYINNFIYLSKFPHGKGNFWGWMTSGFSCMPLSTVPSGPDVGISPHAVDQDFDWPSAEAVDCPVTFCQWRIPLQCNLLSKFLDHLRNYGMYRQSEKNLLNSSIFSSCCHSMVNFSPLAAEFGLPVWGTPANFNGSWVLALLLHRCRSTEVNQLYTMFGSLLGWYTIYKFLGALAPWRNYTTCRIHFASKSCVLLYWQRYCTALE